MRERGRVPAPAITFQLRLLCHRLGDASRFHAVILRQLPTFALVVLSRSSEAKSPNKHYEGFQITMVSTYLHSIYNWVRGFKNVGFG